MVKSRSVFDLDEVPVDMARADSGDADTPEREIRLLKNPDGQWTARDLRVGVTAQGESRTAALDNLDAVVEAVADDGGRPPTDDEIRNLGVDPEVTRSQDEDFPDVLQ
jgi:predicted RNase H-like HicB family nuclease